MFFLTRTAFRIVGKHPKPSKVVANIMLNCIVIVLVLYSDDWADQTRAEIFVI